MLCGVSVVFNSLGDVLGLMCCKCNSEKGQVLIGFQSTEAFGCLHHAGGGPAQRHRGVSPSLHVATDAAHEIALGNFCSESYEHYAKTRSVGLVHGLISSGVGIPQADAPVDRSGHYAPSIDE
jgi:hypothetical protein